MAYATIFCRHHLYIACYWYLRLLKLRSIVRYRYLRLFVTGTFDCTVEGEGRNDEDGSNGRLHLLKTITYFIFADRGVQMGDPLRHT